MKFVINEQHPCYTPTWSSGDERILRHQYTRYIPWHIYLERYISKKKYNVLVENFYQYNSDEIDNFITEEDDVFIGRLDHHIEDKKYHQRIYPIIEQKFKRLFPSNKSYKINDNKIEQFKFLEKNNFGIIKYKSCEDIDELVESLNNWNDLCIIKSSSGAGTESVILYNSSFMNIVDLIQENSFFTFPCVIQDYVPHKFSYKMFIYNNKVFVISIPTIPIKESSDYSKFPFGYENNELWYKRETGAILLEGKELLEFKYIAEEFNKIKELIDTPIIAIDFCIDENGDYNIFEFGVMIGTVLNSDLPYWEYYDLETKTINKEKVTQHNIGFKLMLNELVESFL